MIFNYFGRYLQKLEETTSRNEITAILANLFKKAQETEITHLCYLLLGSLAPKYQGLEFGLAEKMAIRIISQTTERPEKEVIKYFKKEGDLGKTLAFFRQGERKPPKELGINEVYYQLVEIAQDHGLGSSERKVKRAILLLKSLDSLASGYVIRIILGRLRLGFSDTTILDALSWLKEGNKSLRPQIEAAYNVSADIGIVAKNFIAKGLKGIKKIEPRVGIPIRSALAERLPDAKSILEKMKGECFVEPKYDGFRVQVHVDKNASESRDKNLGLFDEQERGLIKIFSRNMEDVTTMFPEIVKAIKEIKASSFILDGEAIGYNRETGKFLPFQETAQRKRKYQVAKMAEEVPLKTYFFDLLYLNKKSFMNTIFRERRKNLERLLNSYNSNEKVNVIESKLVKRPQEIEGALSLHLKKGLEGIVCKKPDTFYQAGARNFNWVKLKKTGEKKLIDTVECLIMGYYRGRGKRANFGIGAFLVGVYDKRNDRFLTISKIGTGLSDGQWRDLKKRVDQIKVKEMPKNYLVGKNLTPDVWAEPILVVEIQSDSVSVSPAHSAKLALRFPRMVRLRAKNPEQITTVTEIKKIYQMQK